jgi:hypothetical protein
VRWVGARDTSEKEWKLPSRRLRELIEQEERERLAGGEGLKG